MRPIGEILLEHGAVRPGDLERALDEHSARQMRTCSYLIDQGLLDPDAASRALGEQHGVAAALQRHLARRDRSLCAALPAGTAQLYTALPLGRMNNGDVIVCVRDPRPELRGVLSRALKEQVVLAVAPATQLEQLLLEQYGDDVNEFDVDLGTQPIPISLELDEAPSDSAGDPRDDAAIPELDNLQLVELDDTRVSKDPSQSGHVKLPSTPSPLAAAAAPPPPSSAPAATSAVPPAPASGPQTRQSLPPTSRRQVSGLHAVPPASQPAIAVPRTTTPAPGPGPGTPARPSHAAIAVPRTATPPSTGAGARSQSAIPLPRTSTPPSSPLAGAASPSSPLAGASPSSPLAGAGSPLAGTASPSSPLAGTASLSSPFAGASPSSPLAGAASPSSPLAGTASSPLAGASPSPSRSPLADPSPTARSQAPSRPPPTAAPSPPPPSPPSPPASDAPPPRATPARAASPASFELAPPNAPGTSPPARRSITPPGGIAALALGTQPPSRQPVQLTQLAETLDALASARTHDDIADAAMRYIASRWTAALLLAVEGHEVSGLRGHGAKLSTEVVHSIGISLDVPSIIASAHATPGRLVTTLPRGGDEIHDHLEPLLGVPRYPAAVGIAVGSACDYVLLVGDPIGQDVQAATGDLGRLATALSAAYTRLER